MPTVAEFHPRAQFSLRPRAPPPMPALAARRRFYQFPLPRSALPTRSRPLVLLSSSSSGASFDEQHSRGISRSRTSKKSALLNLVQEIEPLDLSIIQKDVPANTVDAMKRTISGMLGLLPSDQFHVHVEALWEPLFKLFFSSMKTGYTLRGAEYRLYLEKNLGSFDENTEKEKEETAEDNDPEMLLGSPTISSPLNRIDTNCNHEENSKESFENMGVNSLKDLTPEVQEYICYLQSRLNFAEKALHDIKRRNSALQMHQFVGEEKNDLLDYLRSLHPEKVAELSEPTCPGVDETIHSVVHGLLATLSPKMHSKPPHHPENPTGGTSGVGQDDCAELVENTSIRFQPLISVPRDYLARLLFWCMLLGHYIRGLECRIELMEVLTASSEAETPLHEDDSIA